MDYDRTRGEKDSGRWDFANFYPKPDQKSQRVRGLETPGIIVPDKKLRQEIAPQNIENILTPNQETLEQIIRELGIDIPHDFKDQDITNMSETELKALIKEYLESL